MVTGLLKTLCVLYTLILFLCFGSVSLSGCGKLMAMSLSVTKLMSKFSLSLDDVILFFTINFFLGICSCRNSSN